MIRAAGIFVLAALLPVLAGCFLFGGGDDKKEEKQHQDESLMDASTGAESGTTPAPGTSPSMAVDRGPSQALPIVALGVSGITLISLIVHSRRHRRQSHPEP